MLKKLDYYIIRKYLSSFFFTMLMITMVAVVIDFSEKIGKFINAELPLGMVIRDYYLPFIPWINGMMWPLFSLIAVIFFTSRLAKDSEIVAMLSSGISFNRLLVPYLIGATLIASFLWVGKNYVIPHSCKKKNDFESEHFNKHKKTINNDIHLFLSPDEKIYIRYYRSRDTSAQNFRLEKFDEGHLVEYLKADKLYFKEHPNVWTLKNYEIRKLDGLDEHVVFSDGEELDTILDLTPEDFILNTKLMENMTTVDLRKHIRRERERGVGAAKNFLVQLHQRNSDPFTIIILTVIGMAIAARKIRGGMGIHLAMGVTLGAAFVIVSQFSATFSNNLSFSPALGAWVPNLIFGLIALVLIRYSQK